MTRTRLYRIMKSYVAIPRMIILSTLKYKHHYSAGLNAKYVMKL